MPGLTGFNKELYNFNPTLSSDQDPSIGHLKTSVTAIFHERVELPQLSEDRAERSTMEALDEEAFKQKIDQQRMANPIPGTPQPVTESTKPFLSEAKTTIENMDEDDFLEAFKQQKAQSNPGRIL